MTNSRDIEDLSLNAQEWFKRFKTYVEFETGLIFGIDWGVSRTKCDREYQEWLYAQGRIRPGPIVTWTLNSDHIPGNAWDIFVMRGQAALWDAEKADVDQDGTPDYKEIAVVGRRMGLDVGAYWKPKRDWPHYGVPKTVG